VTSLLELVGRGRGKLVLAFTTAFCFLSRRQRT
jgi:hypothetical protein